MNFRRVPAIPVLILTTVLALAGCGSGGSSQSGSVVRIGTTDRNSAWDTFERVAKRDGITLQTTNFTDYKTPNLALAQQQIDVNLFQHLQFLGQYDVSNNDTLTPIGSTYIVPLALYSKKHKSLAEIPAGGEIAVPNDPTNLARALNVLAAAGLVKFTGAPAQPTAADVDKGASKVKVTTVDATQTALSLNSVDGSVINNTFLERAGIDPHSALYADDPNNPAAAPYINVLAVRAADKSNPTLLKLVDIFHDPEVQQAWAVATKGSSVEVKRPQADLEQILAGVEQGLRAR
ncbi:MetQ/NlpA family ABC transporter substrate-binding protein [Nocardia sp. alder85J]|uniref:MetQ/NlpA family ABC transporter substrate-binding protein n=1 Tax=Nocardia sp. alder85J TaxID=2862949 RepID=UPI001CD1C117|nr:MetQ/NlpA family ABC transporter substrate-binding protein [Nocardia sp. alder85J]MCX4091317.1 MetQ/NlpA family ABC transporter substrate-binding protein [Nocardia sp. alder85J]